MKKYIVIYHATADAAAQNAQMTPEQQAKGMEAWMTWAQKCGNKLVDLGSPLINGQSITAAGTTASNRNVGGYSILQADSMEDAKSLLQGHPHLGWNAAHSIEVHETMAIPGM